MPQFRAAFLFGFSLLCLPPLKIGAQTSPDKPARTVQELLRASANASEAHQPAEAVRLGQEALSQAKTLGDKAGQLAALRLLGNRMHDAGGGQKALEYYEQALPLSRELQNSAAEADLFADKAALYFDTGEPQKAIQNIHSALPLYRFLKNRRGEGNVLNTLGNVYASTGSPNKALEQYNAALVCRREAGDKSGEAATLLNTGNLYGETDRPLQALENFRKARTLFQALHHERGQVICLLNLGLLHTTIGETQKSLALYEEALPLSRKLKDKGIESVLLSDLGTTLSALGKMTEAVHAYQQALPLIKEIGNRRNELIVTLNLGEIYAEAGQPQKALTSFALALTLSRETEDKKSEARTLIRLGEIYFSIGQFERSAESYQQALPVSRSAESKLLEGGALSSLGNLALQQGQRREAKKFYHQSLSLFRAAKLRGGEAVSLIGLGRIAEAEKEWQAAAAHFGEALETSRSSGDTSNQAYAWMQLGKAASGQGQSRQALLHYQAASRLQRRIGDWQRLALTLLFLAKEERKLRHLQAAEAASQEAVSLVEEFRTNLGGYSEAKRSYLESRLSIYQTHLQILLENGKTEAAFALVQRTKARSLLDLLASGRVDLNAVLTPTERTQERHLREKADYLNARMVKEGVENEVGAKKRFAQLKIELAEVERDLARLTETLYARHPLLAQKRIASTVTASEFAALLPSDTALLEYAAVSETELHLFVLTSRGTSHVLIPISRLALTKTAAQFRALCADPRKPYRNKAADLYARLIYPAETLLKGKKRLLICPDGALWDVPFSALMPRPNSSPPFLADRFEIAYAYSATGAKAALTLAKTRTPASQTLLVCADPAFGTSARFGDLEGVSGQRPVDSPSRPIDSPARPLDSPARPLDSPARPFDSPARPLDSPARKMEGLLSRGKAISSLPGTRQEATAIARLFPGATLLTGNAVQESAIKEQMGRYRFVHFATHGFVNDASPLLSSVVLAQPSPGSKDDGFLTAREIYGLDLKAEMVVLSACSTARGETRSGEGMVGLSWALFVAGCPTQVVSQWAVDDASTAALMSDFYRNRVKHGEGKGAALRHAERTLRHDIRYRHPYYWAPFVLFGDWR